MLIYNLPPVMVILFHINYDVDEHLLAIYSACLQCRQCGIYAAVTVIANYLQTAMQFPAT